MGLRMPNFILLEHNIDFYIHVVQIYSSKIRKGKLATIYIYLVNMLNKYVKLDFRYFFACFFSYSSTIIAKIY